jgi:APA family basic amino acid/polyamine antiporter
VKDRSGVSSELSRDLSLFHITMMGLGMMIGAGVFIGIGTAIGTVGPGGVILAFALNGLIALFTAMSFAELSSAIPRAGGAYNFARIAFGRGPSFLAGWMEWFASSVAGSLYAVVFSAYTLDYVLKVVLGMDPSDRQLLTLTRIVAPIVAMVFVYINYRGASETGRIGALFTLGQMVFVGAIAVIGIAAAIAQPQRLANFHPFMPKGWMPLLATMGFIYVAFEGFEVIAQAGDETIDPKRNIPKAMLYSIAIVSILYVAVSFATVVAVKAAPGGFEGTAMDWVGTRGPMGDGETGFGAAVAELIPFGGLLVTLAVIFSSTSALNATIYSATRASYALGRDRMLPAAFARISRRRKTPYVALLFTGGIVLTVAGILPTRDVASSASMMFLFLFFLVNLCVIRVRTNMADELSYGFVMPLFPLFPVLAIVCQAVLAMFIIHMSLLAWIIAPAWVLAGVAIYLTYSRRRAIATDDEIRVFEDEPAPAAAGYRIMVAVANPANALEIVTNTYRLAGAKEASVELLHMVPVPDQVPLADAKGYMNEGREAIVEAMLYLAPLFPISSTIRYCRSVARGIVSAVRQKKIDMLIMGWRGGASAGAFNLGSTVDPVVERTPCSVVVLKDCGGAERFRRVLVPVAGGPNGAMALEVASILADPEEGIVVAFTVATARRRLDVEGFVAMNQHRLALPRERITTRTVESSQAMEAILEEAKGYDLVVVGCTREPLIYQVGRETIPERIAKKCGRSWSKPRRASSPGCADGSERPRVCVFCPGSTPTSIRFSGNPDGLSADFAAA